jgi:hypothetical protein
MERESLEIMQERIHLMVDDPQIPIYDKVEAMINILHFLSPENYEENIKILTKNKENRKID